MRDPKIILMAIAAFVIVVGVFATAVAFVDSDTEGDDIDTPIEVTDAGDMGGVPMFVDAFPPDVPQAEDGARETCMREDRISWADAENHLERRIAVLGPVTDIVEGSGGDPELQLGRTEQETPVTVVFTQDALQALPADPETLYRDEAVCVVGVLRAVGEEIRIFVNQPTDITTL